MNDVPLVNKNDINSINTSLIAIKKQLKLLNEAVGLIETPNSPDLIPYVKKSDIVDTVQSGNMNPITSNAVDNYKTGTVESGNNLPVTSNGVNQELKNCTVCASQVIYSGNGPYGSNGNNALLGAYGYELIDIYIPVPTGYHKAFILSAQITTDNAIKARVRVNNIATTWGGTWSVSTYRSIIYSDPFTYNDIVLEPTYSYVTPGTNLYFETDSGFGNAWVWNITITCYLVKD